MTVSGGERVKVEDVEGIWRVSSTFNTNTEGFVACLVNVKNERDRMNANVDRLSPAAPALA